MLNFQQCPQGKDIQMQLSQLTSCQIQVTIQYLINIDKQMSFRFTEVATCKKTEAQIIDIKNKTSNTIKGDLSVLLQMTTGMLLFKLAEFSYGVNPNDRVIYEDKDSFFKLLLCFQISQDQSWVLKINENSQLIFFILSERCKLIHRNASRILLKQIHESSKKPNQQTEPILEANYAKFRNLQSQQSERDKVNQNISSSMILVEASKSLSKGLAKAGQFIAIGLQKLGTFLSKRIDPSQQIVLSDQTKKLIKTSNQGSKKILEITVEQFSALFRVAKKEAENLVQKFQRSQKGKQLIEKGDYTSYKKKLMTGFSIVANIYQGLTQGLSQAATGLSKGTTQVVEAKYGKDAGFATQNLIQGTRNVYKITQAPYNVAVKQFNPTQAVIKKL